MRTPGRLLLLLLAVLLCTPSVGAFAFFNTGASDAESSARHARRWTANHGALADSGPGLGGGLEYAIAPDLCTQLASSAQGSLSCPDVMGALQESLAAWQTLNEDIRFVLLGGVAPTLEVQGDTSLKPRGAEVDIIALSSHPQLTTTATEVTAATTVTRTENAQGVTLTSGRHADAGRILATDVLLRVDAQCGQAGHVACWTRERLRTVFMHELGHVLGLEHPFEGRKLALAADAPCDDPAAGVIDTSQQQPSVMSYDSIGARTATPSVDDAAGLTVLYPPCKADLTPWMLYAKIGGAVVGGLVLLLVVVKGSKALRKRSKRKAAAKASTITVPAPAVGFARPEQPPAPPATSAPRPPSPAPRAPPVTRPGSPSGKSPAPKSGPPARKPPAGKA